MTQLVANGAAHPPSITILRKPVLVFGPPKPSKQTRHGALMENRVAVPSDFHKRCQGERRYPLFLGRRIHSRVFFPSAGCPNRADFACPSSWCAHRCAKFHQGLVPIARSFGFQRSVSPSLNLLWCRVGLRSLSCHDSSDVAVHTGYGPVKRNAGHRCGSVGPNAGQRQQFVVG